MPHSLRRSFSGVTEFCRCVLKARDRCGFNIRHRRVVFLALLVPVFLMVVVPWIVTVELALP